MAEAFYVSNMASNMTFSHNQEWVTAEALAFVNGPSPWFLYANPTALHSNSPDLKEALFDYELTDTPQGTLASPPDAGATPSRTDLWSRAEAARPCPRSCERKVALAAGALWVDDAVGVMLDELQTLGTLDQTLVLFLMDHGMKGKGRLWEQGTRIAIFARFPPAFAPGTVISEPVSNIDVRRAACRTPTACCLCPHAPTHARALDHNRNRVHSVGLTLILGSLRADRPDAPRTGGSRRRLRRALRVRWAAPRDYSH